MNSQWRVDPLSEARVLLALGDVRASEDTVAAVLDGEPSLVEALELLAKIKHMRGEVSLAVACLLNLRAASSGAGTARAQLEAMRSLAGDPQSGAGPFVSAGNPQLLRMPAAYLALDGAFRLYLADRPLEARAHCRDVANASETRDRETYRLAVHAEALICEWMEDLPRAMEILEHLGERRGFEVDLDRLWSLLGLYVRAGTPTQLRSGLNICRFLERHGETAALGYMVQLAGRLGDFELAHAVSLRHAEHVRRKLQKPTFTELVAVAATRFLPIADLRALLIPGVPLGPEASLRERALAAALGLDDDVAGALFARGGEPLDLQYLAELFLLAGDPQDALRLMCAQFRARPTDCRALGWMLDVWATEAASEVEALLLDPVTGEAAASLLHHALQQDPRDPARWRWSALLHRARGDDRESIRRQGRAQALRAEKRGTIGRANAASVYHFGASTWGLVHEVWAGRQRVEPGTGGGLAADGTQGRMSDPMRELVRRVFEATRTYARARFPDLTRELADFDYSVRIAKDNEPSAAAIGLPAAIAFLSVFLQRPVPSDIAFTGAVDPSDPSVLELRAVDAIQEKVWGAGQRNLRTLVFPAANRVELENGVLLPRPVWETLAWPARDLEEAAELAFGSDLFDVPAAPSLLARELTETPA